jgi:hypothetical protein
MTELRYVECERCGASRSPNLSIPCPSCKSRKIPIFGYTYGIERTHVITILLIILLIAFIFIVLGVGFVIIKLLQIQVSLQDPVMQYFVNQMLLS